MSEAEAINLTDKMAKALPDNYSRGQMHRDFVHTFKNDDTGLRVLQQILKWGNVYGSTIPSGPGPVDVNAVLLNEGMRRLAMRVLETINNEPPKTIPQQRTITKEKQHG